MRITIVDMNLLYLFDVTRNVIYPLLRFHCSKYFEIDIKYRYILKTPYVYWYIYCCALLILAGQFFRSYLLVLNINLSEEGRWLRLICMAQKKQAVRPYEDDMIQKSSSWNKLYVSTLMCNIYYFVLSSTSCWCTSQRSYTSSIRFLRHSAM